MCTSCFTQVDAFVFHAGVSAAVASNTVRRWRDRRAGIGRLEREQRTWLRNAAFARELGFEDPVEVLGPPPGRSAVVGAGDRAVTANAESVVAVSTTSVWAPPAPR